MKPKKVFFICAVNSDIGLGNFSRCLRLANEFLKRKYKVTFILCNSVKVKVSKGIKVIYINSNNLDRELLSIINSVDLKDSICVVDRKGARYNYLREIKKITPFLIDTNAEFKGRNPADLIVRGDITEKSMGRILGGLKFKLLGAGFRPIKQKARINKTIVMSFGGSDPSRFSEFVAGRLRNNSRFNFKLLVGQGYKGKNRINRSKISVIFGAQNLGKFLPSAHAAIVSCGITLYEAFFCGVPCLVVPQNRLQLEEARVLERLGLVRSTNRKNLIKDILFFINDENLLDRLRNNLKGKVDLNAASRIVDAAEEIFRQ